MTGIASAACVLALGAGLAGCGHDEKLPISKLPLPPHARIVAQAVDCAQGDTCSRWAIVHADKDAQKGALTKRGWRPRQGVTRSAVAADSPDGKIFVSFETGAEEFADDATGKTLWGTPKLRATLRGHSGSLAVTLEPGSR